jgi:hypothetical protein
VLRRRTPALRAYARFASAVRLEWAPTSQWRSGSFLTHP